MQEVAFTTQVSVEDWEKVKDGQLTDLSFRTDQIEPKPEFIENPGEVPYLAPDESKMRKRKMMRKVYPNRATRRAMNKANSKPSYAKRTQLGICMRCKQLYFGVARCQCKPRVKYRVK